MAGRLPFVDRYLLDLAILVLTYVMLGWGLNIVVGLAGLLDLGYVAFYAVGAYSYALLATNFELGFWVCLPLAGVIAATFGRPAGFSGAAPARRLSGHRDARLRRDHPHHPAQLVRRYERSGRHLRHPAAHLLRHAVHAAPAEGVTAFHELFGLEYALDPAHHLSSTTLILALALITNLFTLRIRKLPIGRAWEALREDEIACRSLGINPPTPS